jgi:hypothetical protein
MGAGTITIAKKATITKKASLMSWDKEIQELQHRNTLAEAMGGAEKVASMMPTVISSALCPPTLSLVLPRSTAGL